MMQQLTTAEGRKLPEIPWNRYPRPQMEREEWLCLNGSWDLFCHGRSGKILVPFCPESLLSNVDEAPAPGEEMLYRRCFTIPPHWAGKRILPKKRGCFINIFRILTVGE